MFNQDKRIIYVTKTEIEGILVSGGANPKIKARYKLAWNPESLTNSLKQILDKLSNKKIFLLLGEDVSYVVKVNLPQDINSIDERKEVYKEIKQVIPETLGDNEWDYKDYGINNKEKQIIAFAPVKNVFQNVSDSLKKLNGQVDAIEPVQVAKLRNPDPILGIALKTDIKGEDAKTLNLQLFGKKVESNSQTQDDIDKKSIFTKNTLENEKKPRIRKGYLISLCLVLIFGALSISGIYYYRIITPKPIKQHQSEATVFPTSIPTPTVAALDLASVKTSVLNGSGIEGQATYVSDLLKEAGFKNVDTDNADSYDYAETEVQLKESSQSAILEEKLKDILSEYKVEFKNSLQDTSEFDLLIIVGQKK